MVEPLSIANNLVAELNRVLISARRYVATDDLTFRRYLADAKKLVQAKPVEGHNVLAQAYGIVGDHDQARYHADLAVSLAPRDPVMRINRATILSNLGFFSESRRDFQAGAAPEAGMFTAKWRLGLCSASFHVLKDFVAAARRMQLPLDGVNVDLIDRAVGFLDRTSTSETQLASALDIAGDLLRKRRLFFLGPSPEIFVWDQDETEQHVSVIFKVGLTASQALMLDEELGHRLFEAQTGLPFEIMIHFESGLPINERFAERPSFAG